MVKPGGDGLAAVLEDKRLQVEEALRRLHSPGRSPEVEAAASHSLFAPAKRLRPILALLVCEAFRTDPEAVLPAAVAVEMVHTASLILDDLPCMDDAKLRRGRPTCHVAHGQANAILAAFALLNRAYEILAEGWPWAPQASVRHDLARDLANAVGLDGMIAGQAADLAMTGRAADLETLEFIHSRKTGALFVASARVGARASRTRASDVDAVCSFAKNLGLAFQIVDDVIDVARQAGDAGKDVGQDSRKTTFVSFAGLEGARSLAAELVDASISCLAGFGPSARNLRELARYVAESSR
jgi:geranylgeranyl diphosphate synthase type II